MYTFDYQRPEQADAAVKTLTANGDAKYLAGGQSLLPTMRLRLAQPSALVDVTRIASMKDITVSGGTVTIGAAVCHAGRVERRREEGAARTRGSGGAHRRPAGQGARDDRRLACQRRSRRVLSGRRARAERDGGDRPPPHR